MEVITKCFIQKRKNTDLTMTLHFCRAIMHLPMSDSFNSSFCFCRTLAVIKPDAVKKVGQILNKIRDNALEICRGKMFQLSRDNAAVLYEEHKQYPYYV